jgi:hypothetical protein
MTTVVILAPLGAQHCCEGFFYFSPRSLPIPQNPFLRLGFPFQVTGWWMTGKTPENHIVFKERQAAPQQQSILPGFLVRNDCGLFAESSIVFQQPLNFLEATLGDSHYGEENAEKTAVG